MGTDPSATFASLCAALCYARLDIPDSVQVDNRSKSARMSAAIWIFACSLSVFLGIHDAYCTFYLYSELAWIHIMHSLRLFFMLLTGFGFQRGATGILSYTKWYTIVLFLLLIACLFLPIRDVFEE